MCYKKDTISYEALALSLRSRLHEPVLVSIWCLPLALALCRGGSDGGDVNDGDQKDMEMH